MAQTAKKEGSFMASLVIILLAAGVVAIGIFPMRGDLKRITRRAQLYLQENFNALSLKGEPGKGGPNSRAMMLDSNEVLKDPAPRKPKGIEDLSKNPPKQPVDRLTPDDRKELNELVNSF